MRASPLSLTAESVFRYDLQRELEIDLNRLRKTACDDGDVVFILCDHTCIWAHSPLFYIASKNKMPAEFGTVTGRSINDRGITVTMLSVPEEKRPKVEMFMEACYTQDTLLLLWKAMGGDDVYFDTMNEQMNIDTSLINSTLPASMLPDFEIHLGGIGSDKVHGLSRSSVKVHRFLLEARIDYYQAKARSGSKFKDATSMASNLSRTVFTDFSLWAISMYVYRGMPSIILNLDPNFEGYISLNKDLRCSVFRTKGHLPAEGIENWLLEISRAANFLLIPQLENWAHFQIYRLAHRFKCTGSGCAEIIPYIIEAVYRNDITDEWMFNTGIAWLARYENIPNLWKWSLLHKPRVVVLLIEKIKEFNMKEETEENISPRGENAIELFLRLWKLEQYTSMTKDSEKWGKDLIKPLMEHAIGVILEDLESSIIFARLDSLVHGRSFLKLAGEDLLRRVIEKVCKEIHVKDSVYIKKLMGLDKKKDLPQKVPRLKRNTSVEKKNPQLAENQVANDQEDLVDNQTPNSHQTDSSNTANKDNIGKKQVDSRLKGSAPTFIPRGIHTPLNNLGNTPGQTDSPASPLVDDKHRPLGELKIENQNWEVPESEESLTWSGSEDTFKATVTQARRQGFKMRRIISTPVSKGDETHEIRARNRLNENRRFTSPTIGGAIPFSQQMKMSSFYDPTRWAGAS